MSNFIFSIIDPAPALMLYPPESKVRPLPTSATFFAALPPGGMYVRWMNLGGSHALRHAEVRAHTHRLALGLLEYLEREGGELGGDGAACAAIVVGVSTFAGEPTSAFVSSTPYAIFEARSSAAASAVPPSSSTFSRVAACCRRRRRS